ncbi:Aerobactin synthase IucA [Cedecea neteri]|uniref:Aerobactin synthase IucA n=1 Tax=Cedecea neteri TaxID=158822 RepID=A0A2X3JDN7_9ENTR|nr:Aerobactin synthase IucA [Cedecea neteri]
MGRVRSALSAVRDEVTHKTCLDYVLESPHWNVKGNFFCYLHDHNENTIVDPSVIYFDFVNPLQAQEAECFRHLLFTAGTGCAVKSSISL